MQVLQCAVMNMQVLQMSSNEHAGSTGEQ
jgi:hypothetical protein